MTGDTADAEELAISTNLVSDKVSEHDSAVVTSAMPSELIDMTRETSDTEELATSINSVNDQVSEHDSATVLSAMAPKAIDMNGETADAEEMAFSTKSMSDKVPGHGSATVLSAMAPKAIDMNGKTADAKEMATSVNSVSEKVPEHDSATVPSAMGLKDTSLDDSAALSPKEWRRELLCCLSSSLLIAPLAHFEAEVSLTNPGLIVHGADKIGLPLSSRDVKCISDVCRNNGSSDATKVEITGNRPWELRPKDFVIRNPEWEKTVSSAVKKVAKELNISTDHKDLRADLQKLLVFEPGHSFKFSPRPVVAPGLVATLAVFLPSEHQGGQVVSSYGGISTELNTSGCSDFKSSILAWFADTSTEIKEVTSGVQCVLLYDLSYVQLLSPISARVVSEVSQQLETLITAWSKPRNHNVFRAPLFYMLNSQKATSLDSLDGRDYHLASLLKQICAKSETEIYLADVEKEEEGAYRCEDDITDESDQEYYLNGYYCPKSTPSRSPTPEIIEIINDEEVKYKADYLCTLDGNEFARDLDIEEWNFIEENPFWGDPIDSDHDRANNYAKNTYAGTAFVLVPKHLSTKFLLDHDIVDAEEILEDDIEAFEEPAADSEARNNLITTCELFVGAYSDSFKPDPTISWGASLSTESFLALLLKALALVGIKPISLWQTFDFSEGKLRNLPSPKLKVLATVVRAIGFQEAKEKLTCGVLSINNTFPARYRFLHQFGLQWFCSSSEPKEADQDKSAVVRWVEQQVKESLAKCAINWETDFDSIIAAYSNYGTECLDIIEERLKKEGFKIQCTSFLVDAGVAGKIPENKVLSICRPPVSFLIRGWCNDIPLTNKQNPFGKQYMTKLESFLHGRVMQESLATSLYHCFYLNLQEELGQVITRITGHAITKTKEELDSVYWSFLGVLSPLLQKTVSWTENREFQALYRTIIQRMIQQHLSPSPPPPPNPTDWTKASRGCGCKGPCVLLDQFLKNPSKERQYFKLPYQKKYHLNERLTYPHKPEEDDIVKNMGSGGITITKTNSTWKNAHKAWRETSLAVATKITKLIPEPLLKTFLGEEIFELWKQLHQLGSSPIPTLAFEQASPQSTSSHLSASQPHPRTPLSANQNSLNQSTQGTKRPFPWQSQEDRPPKKPVPSAGLREERIADEWVLAFKASRPLCKASNRHLQVYSIWQHKNFSCEQIAQMLRDPPLLEDTVKGYVLQAVTLEDLPYDRERMKEVAKDYKYVNRLDSEKFDKLLAQLK